MKKSIACGVALALVTAGAGALLLARSHDAPVSFAFACEPGSAEVYRIAYDSVGELSDLSFGLAQDEPASAGPKPTTKVAARATGLMVAACIESGPTEHTLALTFESLEGDFRMGEGSPAQPSSQLLAGTTFVTRGRDGKVASIRFEESMSEQGRGMVRDILGLSQLVLPNDAVVPATWHTREEGVNGAFEAAYGVDGRPQGKLSISKKRVAGAKGVQGPHADPDATSGGSFVLDPKAQRLDRAKVHVGLTLKLGPRTVGTTAANLDTARTGSRTVSAERLASFSAQRRDLEGGGATPSDLAARDEDEKLERRMQENELGTDTWSSLSERATDPRAERVKTFLKMKALFLLHPETCRTAAKSLVGMKSPNDQAFVVTAAALAAAGTKEAQEALVSATHAVEAHLPKARALVATLGALKNPTPETFAALSGISERAAEDELRGTSRLALGALARATPDATEAHQVVEKEIAGYRAATTTEGKTLALLSLGNTGAENVVEVASAASLSDDAQVRNAAMQALRHVRTPEADALLTNTALHDEGADVRAEAFRSMLGRELGPGSTDAAARALQTDGDERVRMAAVQVLGADMTKDPALTPILERVAKQDIAAAVRNAAEFALERSRLAVR